MKKAALAYGVVAALALVAIVVQTHFRGVLGLATIVFTFSAFCYWRYMPEPKRVKVRHDDWMNTPE